MRMPRPQFRLKPNLKRRVLNAFVKLEQMRMTGTDACPNYFHDSFWRKCSDVFDRQKESAKFDCEELFAQSKIDIPRHVGKKAERKMNLVRRRPAHSVNVRVEIC